MSSAQIVPVLFVVVQSSQQFSIINELISGLLAVSQRIMIILLSRQSAESPYWEEREPLYTHIWDPISHCHTDTGALLTKIIHSAQNIFTGIYHSLKRRTGNVKFSEYLQY